jgi:hypothetical protein
MAHLFWSADVYEGVDSWRQRWQVLGERRPVGVAQYGDSHVCAQELLKLGVIPVDRLFRGGVCATSDGPP